MPLSREALDSKAQEVFSWRGTKCLLGNQVTPDASHWRMSGMI